MSANPDGGPVFPTVVGFADPAGGAWRQVESTDGMTLRDYFAAKALAGLVANPQMDFPQADSARIAYLHADAMLAERAKRGGE